MSIKENLEYLNFFIKNLSVNLVTDIKPSVEEEVNIEISLGFAEPDIIKESSGRSVAVFPYKFDFKSIDQVNITSEFIIGFALKQDSINDVDSLKYLVNNNKDEFVKHITKAVNQIIDNALEHTNIRFEDNFLIEPIEYK